MALIQMKDVTKDYRLGETVVHALRGITLRIDEREFVAVWGPSGSGKTTLLNLIGAIDEPTSGYLSFNGQEISKLSDDRKSELRSKSVGFVGLTDFVKHRPDKLSGGQQQRVAIARALVTNPSLIIADEPTGNLDSDTARRIIELMRNLNSTEGTTFIFSTHDQRLLGDADRLVRLEDGRILREEKQR